MTEKPLTVEDVGAYLRQHERKDLLRFLTAGSVDDGKSTLIGRLLYDSKMIYEDQLAAVIRDSAVHGTTNTEFDPALLTDGLKAEREQGITIDVAYRYFSTDKRKFIIADTPGHEQYTRNMATGASTCQLSIILIDARHGVLPQTKRHSFIASLLGIRHLVVAVNKMDTVDYAQDVFEAIRDDYMGFAAKLEVGEIHFIPMSALKGDNVVEPSSNMPWYRGEPLLPFLENVQVAADRNLIDLRFPVQYVLRPDLNFRGYCGTLCSGVIRKGDEIMVLPSGQRTRVKSLISYEGELEEAFPPMAVTVTTEDEVDISRGNMIVHPGNVPHVGVHFDAMLVWMHEKPLTVGRQYLLKQTTNMAPAVVSALDYRIDVNTMHRQDSEVLQLNEIGRIRVAAHRPLCFDSYERNRGTGCFVLVDRISNATVAAGMILDREPNKLVVDTRVSEEPKSEHTRRHASAISGEERAARLGQKPMTVWLTGLPKSGKSTIAFGLERRLFDMGYFAHVLDGENMRRDISKDLAFSGNERAENIRRAAGIARICSDAGLLTIAAFVSPYAEDRERAKASIGAERFMEVYLSAPAEVCEQRDTDGLYAKARAGEIEAFSGVTAPYEAPENPDVLLATDTLSAEECVDRIVDELKKRRIIS